MKINQIDAIQLLKSLPDNSVDLIFTDPPYALGSEVIIRPDGKPDYKKEVDFMAKWRQPDGKFWEEWFIEAFRVLKYGGRVVMFGMDRQLMLNKYYACSSEFVEQQSLYWYFASSMPKAVDLSKMIDKHFGEEREVIGRSQWYGRNPNGRKHTNDIHRNYGVDSRTDEECNIITNPSSDLAKKYDGFKYSISPLKQTNETIMVFQKPYKTKSALHDTLAYENGDEECLCGALNIDGSRVPIDPNVDFHQLRTMNRNKKTHMNGWGMNSNSSDNPQVVREDGRFPPQTFCDSETAKILDEQSGISKSSGGSGDKSMGALGKNGKYGKFALNVKSESLGGFGDSGGCSKILHKCDYDEIDHDLYFYCPKIDKKERNMGNIENNHPTVKPISLLLRILNLFKTPNPQVVVDTFAGSGSIPIAAELLGFEVIAGDLDEGFVEISKARLDFAVKNKTSILKKHKQPEPIKPSPTNQTFF